MTLLTMQVHALKWKAVLTLHRCIVTLGKISCGPCLRVDGFYCPLVSVVCSLNVCSSRLLVAVANNLHEHVNRKCRHSPKRKMKLEKNNLREHNYYGNHMLITNFEFIKKNWYSHQLY